MLVTLKQFQEEFLPNRSAKIETKQNFYKLLKDDGWC